jgi:hypothetical protein
MLAPTPRNRMLDRQGRPYFLWDVDMTMDEFMERVATAEPAVRASLIGKMMRQAKPDDALQFVSAQQIADQFPLLEKHLGRTREFWAWLLDEWRRRGIIRR